MNQNILPRLLAFLAAAPALQDLTLGVEEAGPAPGTGGLWPQGVTVAARRPDLLGGVTLRCRADFTLRLCLPLPPGDNAAAQANAGRLLALESWVAAQSALHALLALGDEPATETLQAENGRLERVEAGGTACYTLRLRAEYTETYKEETP